MSDYIPFEVQSEIIKRLPVKSLVKFRSISKQWKSFIDNPEFIENYHVNHRNPQHHLLVRYKLDTVETYISIVDDNTFPAQKLSLTAPESLRLMRDTLTLGSVNGLLCFCGFYGDMDSEMAVIWNPSIRKSVSIVIPKAAHKHMVVGFGICPDTSDPKLVKISVAKIPSLWEVDVFTLRTHRWETVYTGALFKSCDLSWLQAFVDGVIYFRAYDDIHLDHGVRSNFVISFDLKSEKFNEVCLPERLVNTPLLDVTKVNESLGLLEYYVEGEMWVCGVWRREDGANKPFSKIYTVKVEGKLLFSKVLEFRNNGEVVTEVLVDDNYEESRIKVYEPFSGHIKGVGINGRRGTFSVHSYMETVLLLHGSDSIIHH